MKTILHFKGSATSGNHGHAGRPGERGGSAPSGEGGGSGLGPNGGYPIIKPKPAPAKVTRPVRTRELEDVVSADGIRNGIPKAVTDIIPTTAYSSFEDPTELFTFGKSFYYRSGTPEGFAAHVQEQLAQADLQGELVSVGEHYYPGFVGGAKIFSAKDSFYYAVMKVTRRR